MTTPPRPGCLHRTQQDRGDHDLAVTKQRRSWRQAHDRRDRGRV